MMLKCLSVTVLKIKVFFFRQMIGVKDIIVATRGRKIPWAGHVVRLADGRHSSSSSILREEMTLGRP